MENDQDPKSHGRLGPMLRGPDVLYRALITRDALTQAGGIRLQSDRRRQAEVITRSMAGELAMDNGLFLSFAREVHLSALETETTIIPCASIKIFLSGDIRASLNDTPFPMPLRKGGQWQPSGVVVSHAERAVFRRQAPQGSFLTKVVIDIPHDWIRRSAASQPALMALLREDFGFWPWEPGHRARFLAEEILALSEKPQPFTPLLLESCALGLMSEALSATLLQAPVQEGTATDLRRLAVLEEFLALHPDHPASSQEIADHLGSSVSTIQRSVKRLHGCSLAVYLRNRRLEQARQGLLLGHASLSEIAWAAGYTSASNFSTAFRARYGMSPSTLRPLPDRAEKPSSPGAPPG